MFIVPFKNDRTQKGRHHSFNACDLSREEPLSTITGQNIMYIFMDLVHVQLVGPKVELLTEIVKTEAITRHVTVME